MLAAREGRTEVVSLLLEAGANTDLQNMVKLCMYQEVWFWNSICTKSSSSHSHISVTTQYGDSALTMAARKGRTEVVSLLLQAGANTDLQNMVYQEVWFWNSICTKSSSSHSHISVITRMETLH